ncbi:MAG: chromosome segregation protein SMC [Candidatus Rokubacteria bacterium]|nr:chromosome segregation protein SMC [Candidatus Rokubacteria bacterium]
MRLESITLHGFKSFGEKTSIRVLPGVTAVVGPNGCGKSNVGESIRWALGEQSVKSLRGHRMEDVIFHGSASRKPVGMAEVELLFSNDGTVSVPFAEVSVARRLYRTGESEYLLNKSVCRLRDLLDLFAGTGANPRAYSVMDQEKLNHVLIAKPHERRVFIEEAAGIARYKQQRAETRGKLDATRQNLARVRDVMDEVKRQLTSLERQAKKAQQYKALQQERRELSLVLAAADYATLAQTAARVEAEIGRLRTGDEDLRTRLSVLAGREARERDALQQSEQQLGDLRQAVQKVQGELERLLERREQMAIQMREANEEVVRLDSEIRLTNDRLAAIGGEREQLRQSLGEAEAVVAERTQTTRVLEGAVEQHRTGLSSDRDRLETLRLEQVKLAGERTDLMRRAGELRERQNQLLRREERLAAEMAQADAEAERLAAQRAAAESARGRAIVEMTSLAAERETLEATFAARERELSEGRSRLSELRVGLAARRSSLASLRELERVREGYGAGVRAVFTDGPAAGLRGVVGTVADLLDVPRGLERPVEAVLGERLQWIVVERFTDARAGVAFLHERRGGAATFLPLECLGAKAGPDTDFPDHVLPAVAGGSDARETNGTTHEPSGVTWIASEVRALSADLVRHLLGNVGVVESLDRAEALWRRNGVVATYVTPAGEVLSPTGRLRGGDDAVATEHSLLGRKREIRELEDQVAELERDVEELQARVAGLEAETQALRARLPQVRNELAASDKARVASEKDLEQSVRDQERVQRHRETVSLEAGQVSAELQEARATLDRLEEEIVAARDAEASHERAMAALRATIERGQGRESELVAELTAYRVELASASERVDALGRDLARLDQMEADLGERLTQSRQRQDQTRERVAWLAGERERTDAAAREVGAERDRLEEESRTAAAYHAEVLAALRAVEADTRAAEAEVRALTNSIHGLELRATETRVRREELAEEARRSFGVDAAALLERHDPDRDTEELRQRIGELGEKLDAFGGVNLVADDEYRELDERLTFLRTQHEDLVASLKDLEKALRGMTRTAQERFTEAFAEINARFSQIFERLFEGGRAELRLVEAEEGGDALDTGVELMAQPRGKRLQSVTLMSGGERALTGLALLFAIFYYRPSPFCVLDEVDAPLDDANIGRFLRVLKELTTQTQFLVITHNRKTMEAADILYGVTMQEPGLSKVVSVNLNH